MTLSKIRRQGAIFFGVISILIIAFYSSPQFLDRYQSNKPYQSFYQLDYKNPIVFCKVFENLTYTHSLPKLHVAEHHVSNIAVDAALEVTTSKALLVVTYLRNVFYVFVCINAP